MVAWVRINDFENPSDHLIPYHILSASNNEVLSVLKGYANGLKALEPDSEIMIFSDMSLDETVKENIRYPADKWFY